MSAAEIKQDCAITTQEQWSLLVDGELDAQELDELMAHCGDDDLLMTDWYTYHVIGDVLRSPDLAQAHMTLAKDSFMEAFRKRLAKEPLIVAPSPINPVKEKKPYLRLHWPHWASWAAASGFVAMAVMAVVYTVQDSDGMQQGGARIVAAVPTSLSTAGIAAHTQAQVQRAVSRAPTYLANSTLPAWVFASGASTVGAMPVQMQRGAAPLNAQSLASLPDIRLDTTPEGRVWRDQRFDPYISAHQQLGNSAVFNITGNGYLNSSINSQGSSQ